MFSDYADAELFCPEGNRADADTVSATNANYAQLLVAIKLNKGFPVREFTTYISFLQILLCGRDARFRAAWNERKWLGSAVKPGVVEFDDGGKPACTAVVPRR